ncbi:hypothetical protein [Weissella confusa]|uniref:Uncharacterized protein n=1 Tax=Weissella confusa TaxID=1583 RepID=A0AA40YTJ5_WEICO|nr:hypothetical protein [Weissella confusa]MBJ7639911.1 hypothetical protein [Weissella confusa]
MYKKITSWLITLFSKIKAFFSKPITEQTASLSGNSKQSRQYSQNNNSGTINNGDKNIYGDEIHGDKKIYESHVENKDIRLARDKAKLIKLETEIYQIVRSSHLNTEDSITAVGKKASDLMEDAGLLVSEISSVNEQYLSKSLKKAISNVNIGSTKYLSARRCYIVFVKNGVVTNSQIENKLINQLNNAINEFDEAYDELNKFS